MPFWLWDLFYLVLACFTYWNDASANEIITAEWVSVIHIQDKRRHAIKALSLDYLNVQRFKEDRIVVVLNTLCLGDVDLIPNFDVRI